MRPFELPEPSHRGGALGVHLRAVEVISLAVVASLGPEILDLRRAGHQNSRVSALRLGSRAASAARRSAASCLSSACLVEIDAICAARRCAELGRRFVGCTDTVTFRLAAITVSLGQS